MESAVEGDNLCYERKQAFTGGHQDAINCIAFSPTGEYLATAGSDHKIIIWCCTSGSIHQCFIAESPVTALIWPTESTNIVAGTANGLLMTFQIEKLMITVAGRHLRSGPIESLDITHTGLESPHLLLCGQSEVSLWRCESADMMSGWVVLRSLPLPPLIRPFPGNHEVRVTSARWSNQIGNDIRCVVVSYLHHGVICWKWDNDFKTAEIKWSIHAPLCGPVALSADNCHVVVGNLKTGFNVYRTSSQECLGKLEVPTDAYDRCLPAIFLHKGKAILSGSAVGKVRLWDSNDLKLIQTLRHREEDGRLIQALAASYKWDDDRFLIATGSSTPGAPNSVLLWEASKQSMRKILDENPQPDVV